MFSAELLQQKIVRAIVFPYVRDMVSKLIMDGMKLSLFRIDRMIFQSVVSPSFSNRQMDSSASLTTAGGLAIERTSASCFFLMPLTADHLIDGVFGWGGFGVFNMRASGGTQNGGGLNRSRVCVGVFGLSDVRPHNPPAIAYPAAHPGRPAPPAPGRPSHTCASPRS